MTETTTLAETSRCTIRALQAVDVPAILDIIRSVRHEYGIQQADLPLFDHYRRRRAAYFVAFEGRVLVGGAGIAPLHEGDAQTCELQRMYLRPESRGLGIGRQLLDSCLHAATQRGFTRCYAETVSDMDAAIDFYSRNGFRALDTPMGSTGHTHNDRWMLLELPCAGEPI